MCHGLYCGSWCSGYHSSLPVNIRAENVQPGTPLVFAHLHLPRTEKTAAPALGSAPYRHQHFATDSLLSSETPSCKRSNPTYSRTSHRGFPWYWWVYGFADLSRGRLWPVKQSQAHSTVPCYSSPNSGHLLCRAQQVVGIGHWSVSAHFAMQ